MATIKRADGSILNNEAPVKMEEIITNEDVKETEPEIHLENEADEVEVSPISGAEAPVDDVKVIKRDGITIEAPWWRFYNLVENMFLYDPAVKLSNNNDDNAFEITITSPEVCKLAAIRKVIGTERTFGNIKVVINYVEEEAPLTLEEFAAAFKDTEYLVDTVTAQTPAGVPLYFPIMKKDVIQFYDDNIADYYGNLNITVANATMEIMDVKNLRPDFLISTEVVKSATEEE